MSGTAPQTAPPARSLRRDVAWNAGSFALVGVAGVLLNLLVARVYGAAALGAFNQVLAAYVLFSQFAAGGVHLSVLREVARSAAQPASRGVIVASAVALTVALSALSAAVFRLCAAPIGAMLDSDTVAIGIAWAAPALFLFGVNKTLLGVLNGMQWMRVYAVAQVLRPAALIAACGVAIAFEQPASVLPAALTVGEVAVLLVAGPLALIQCRPAAVRELLRWTVRHLNFGARSAGSGVLLELNARVDVLMLGCFTSDARVGSYSFASMLLEGFSQLPLVVRTNVNPMLAQMLASERRDDLAALIRRVYSKTFRSMLAISLAAIALYPIGLLLTGRWSEFGDSWLIFAILMTGMALTSGFAPFSQLLLQSGHPLVHTLLSVGAVAFNAAGNLLLIPLLGGAGSAIATAAAYVFATWLLLVLARRLVGVPLAEYAFASRRLAHEGHDRAHAAALADSGGAPAHPRPPD